MMGGSLWPCLLRALATSAARGHSSPSPRIRSTWVNTFGRSLKYDLALLHGNDPIRQDGFFHFMGDIHDGDVLFPVQFQHRTDDFLPAPWIQHGRGFVKDNAPGLQSQHPGNGHPLFLPP